MLVKNKNNTYTLGIFLKKHNEKLNKAKIISNEEYCMKNRLFIFTFIMLISASQVSCMNTKEIHLKQTKNIINNCGSKNTIEPKNKKNITIEKEFYINNSFYNSISHADKSDCEHLKKWNIITVPYDPIISISTKCFQKKSIPSFLPIAYLWNKKPGDIIQLTVKSSLTFNLICPKEIDLSFKKSVDEFKQQPIPILIEDMLNIPSFVEDGIIIKSTTDNRYIHGPNAYKFDESSIKEDILNHNPKTQKRKYKNTISNIFNRELTGSFKK